MKQRFRLRRQADFQAALGGRRFHSGTALVGFAVPNPQGHGRVGVAVSRTLKGAVERNLARRRLREAARVAFLAADSPLSRVGIRYDVVLIARRRALDMPFADLEAEASSAALRLSKLNP